MRDVWLELQGVLPVWVGWFCIVYPVLAGPWAWLSGRLAVAVATRSARRSVPLTAASPWTERARFWRAPRAAARFNFAMFVVFAAVVPAMHHGPLHHWSYVACGCIAILAAAIGGWTVSASLARQINPSVRVAALFRASLTRCFVLYPHVAVAGVAALWLPSSITAVNVWQFASVGALITAAAFGAGTIPARLLGLVRPASERLLTAVSRAATQVGHAPRVVYTMDLGSANAFAFPLIDRVGFSRDLEENLDDDELQAIAAHELAHLREPKALHLTRALVLLMIVLPWAATGLVVGHFGVYGMVPLPLVTLVVALAWRRASRRMEERADQVAHATTAYARALEKIYRANLAPAVLRTATSHPHLYDRLLAAGATPEYPRPAPPPRLGAAAVVVIVMLYAYALSPYALNVHPGAASSDTDLQLRLAVSGGSAWPLGELGRRAWRLGELNQAALFYRGASLYESDSSDYAVRAVYALIRGDRCEDARAELASQLSRSELTTTARIELMTTTDDTEACGRPAREAEVIVFKPGPPLEMPKPEILRGEEALKAMKAFEAPKLKPEATP